MRTGTDSERSLEKDHLDSKNRSFFDRWSRTYDQGRISGWFQYTQELTIGFLKLKPGSWVLDVGCGTGQAVLRLASLVPEGKACGIDISAGMIQQAKANAPDTLQNKMEFVQASSDSIPYPDGQFDHLICTNSFHHYPDPIKALKEMQRVLKPGGQMVIFENALELSWYTWLWDKLLRFFEKGHVRYYTSSELGEMIKKAGFVQAKLEVLRNEFLKHGKLFASLQVWNGSAP